MAQPQTSITENPAAGMSGQLYDMNDYDSESMVNAEVSAAITPGFFVINGATTDAALLPSALTDISTGKARGFAIYQDLHINPSVLTNTDRAKYVIKEYFPVARRGRMWITCPKAYTRNGLVYIRCLATDPTYPNVGQIHPDVGSYDVDGAGAGAAEAHCTLLTYARFLTSGIAGTLALVEFDVKPAS